MSEKKKLLFIIPALTSGGAEKSLVTLLTLADRSSYEIDLLVFRREGLFLPALPEDINVFDGGSDYAAFDGSSAAYIKDSVKKLRISSAARRLDYGRALRAGDRAKTWSCLREVLSKPDKEYDAAIGYLEGNAIYYCVDCVKAKKKIGYVHNDYSKLGLDPGFDAPYFDRLDYLVTVSPECAKVLGDTFPGAASKVRVIENITSPRLLEKLAEEDAPEYAQRDGVRLLTTGRLREQKGCDIAVEAAAALRGRGLAFTWFWIGAGEQKEMIEGRIKELGLEDSFILLGERANPYPYVRSCDIYVQPSRFEGKSIAIDEAKCLRKPIVATRFTTVADQLTDGETALLAEIDPADIAEKIYLLAGDKALGEKLSDNLSREKVGNEEEIAKFYELLY